MFSSFSQVSWSTLHDDWLIEARPTLTAAAGKSVCKSLERALTGFILLLLVRNLRWNPSTWFSPADSRNVGFSALLFKPTQHKMPALHLQSCSSDWTVSPTNAITNHWVNYSISARDFQVGVCSERSLRAWKLITKTHLSKAAKSIHKFLQGHYLKYSSSARLRFSGSALGRLHLFQLINTKSISFVQN